MWKRGRGPREGFQGIVSPLGQPHVEAKGSLARASAETDPGQQAPRFFTHSFCTWRGSHVERGGHLSLTRKKGKERISYWGTGGVLPPHSPEALPPRSALLPQTFPRPRALRGVMGNPSRGMMGNPSLGMMGNPSPGMMGRIRWGMVGDPCPWIMGSAFPTRSLQGRKWCPSLLASHCRRQRRKMSEASVLRAFYT